MMKPSSKIKHPNLIILILSLLLLLLIGISFLLGRYPVPLRELLGILAGRIFPITPFWTERMQFIVFNVRLPRIFAACLVGCSLSAAGAAYQGVFQNPMASPDILGATAGAAFGAALAILLSGSSRLIMLSAFCFSLLTVLLVWLISLRARGSRVLGLILSGIMISSLFSAGTSFLKLVADPTDQLPAITYWLMGSLAGIKANDLLFVTIPMLGGLLILLLLRWRINILTLGDDQARTMGINAKMLRLLVILASTLITAAAVSVSGMIGWVGLVIPHLSRRLVGSNYRLLLPVSMLFGALFLLLVDNVSRNLLAIEIPIGILTALIGAPFFLYLITGKGEQL